MENRISKLEQAIIGIDAKLDRIAPIEAQLSEIKVHLSQLPKAAEFGEMKGQLSQMPKASDLAAINKELGEIKGKLSNMPNTMTLLGMILSTWTAGAAIVFTLLRFGTK